MHFSRRDFIKGSAAAAALGAWAVLPLARAAASAWAGGAPGAARAPGDVVGKVTVGYQGWFAAPGDGAPINGWWHWSRDWAQAPRPDLTAIKAWPDMRGYTHGYATGYAALGNGQPATLFSSYDQQTVDTHLGWMQQNGIDTVALRRFNPYSQEGPTRDAMAAKVRQAAEAYGRKFYIMYDVSGWTDMRSQLKQDWSEKMLALTASPAHARQNGKPVVCLWGFGFDDASRPFDAASCAEVLAWFKAQGCYVIGGVPTHWRNGESVRPDFLPVFRQFDMLSPWMIGMIGMIGVIGSIPQADDFFLQTVVADKADCDAHGIDYQPCVLPGDLSEGQRSHGNFMWRQFYNLAGLGVAGFYISMFDEYNEGNQIAKTAETQADVPSDGGFASLDEDGVACSSDYYLRLSGDGGRMLKGLLPPTPVRPTAPMPGSTAGLATVISLRSWTNRCYVTAEDAGDQPLIANRATIGEWERFDLVDAGNGDVALRAHANGLYVTAEDADAQPMVASRAAIGPWETFRLQVQPNTGGAVALLARANGRYVSTSNAGQGALLASGPAVGGWELFDLTIA